MSSSSSSSSSSSPPPKLIAFFDFDYTIIDENSDTYIFEALHEPSRKLLSKLHKEGVHWTDVIDSCLVHLNEHGFTADHIRSAFASIPLPQEMDTLLRHLHESGAEIHILSDANTEFIKMILEAKNLSHVVSSIISNPGAFDPASGALRVTHYHSSGHSCPVPCPKNLCKGIVLDNILSSSSHPTAETTIYYFGDGSNDICPSLRLKPNSKDTVFVRSEFGFHKALKRMESDEKRPKCQIVYWPTYGSLLDSVQSEMRK